MQDRLTRIRAALAEVNLDALLVSAPVDDGFGRHADNRKYVSGFTGSTGMALVTMERAVFAADFRYTEQAELECTPRGFEVFKALGTAKEWVPAFLEQAALGGKRLGVSRADMSLAGWVSLQERVADMDEPERPILVPAPPIVERLRRVKDADELVLLQRAIDVSDAACAAVLGGLHPDQSEIDVAEQFELEVLAAGGDGVSFQTIAAAGPWSAMPHAQPRPEPLGEGRPFVLDAGAVCGGYCSDLTRTVYLGEADDTFRKVYAIVHEAQQAAIDGVRPGMTGVEAHRLAFDVIERHGYGDRFGHGLGHGVGLQVHESPYLGFSSEDVLEDGMVFTIEPGIYLPGWGGVRIEDIVVLEDGRARVLSRAPKLAPAGV